MFTLISLGVGIAYLYSVAATIAPDLFPAALREHGVVPNYFEAPIDTGEMLARATRAMRQSRASEAGQWISRFEAAGAN